MRGACVLTLWIALILSFMSNGAKCHAQSYDVDKIKFGNNAAMSDDNKKVINSATKFLTVIMARKHKNIACPKKTKKTGKIKFKKVGKTGRIMPEGSTSGSKKYKVGSKKKGANPAGGNNPPSTGGTGASGVSSKLTWAEVLKCVGEVDQDVGDNQSDGENEKKVNGTVNIGTKKITYEKSYLNNLKPLEKAAEDEDKKGLLDFLSFCGLAYHETLHTKQTKRSEKAAWHAQLLVYCWIEDFLEDIIANPPGDVSPDESDALNSMAAALKVTTAGQTPSAIASATLSALIANGFKNFKTTSQGERDLATAYVPGGGPFPGASGGTILVAFKDFNNATITANVGAAATLTFSADDPPVVHTLSIHTPFWATLIDRGNGTELLVGGHDASGSSRIVVFSDGVDPDTNPDAQTADIAVAGDVSAVHVHDVVRNSGATDLFLLDVANSTVDVVTDTDTDGIPDTVSATPFSNDPLIGQRGGYLFRGDEGASELIIAVRTNDDTVDQLPKSLLLKDTNGDLVADSATLNYDAIHWPEYLNPVILDRVPDAFDTAGALDWESSFLPGQNKLYCSTGGSPGDTATVRNLSNSSAVLGTGTAVTDSDVIEVSLANALVAGQLIEVELSNSGKKTVQFIPINEERSSQNGGLVHSSSASFASKSWDFDGNGVNDYVVRADEWRFLIGLRDLNGHVTSEHRLLFPWRFADALDFATSTSTAIQFADVEEEFGLVTDTANMLTQVVGAPGPGVAFTGLDIDNDGDLTDSYVVLETSTGLPVLHYSVSDNAGIPVWQFVELALGTDEQITQFELFDADGDGDQDIIVDIFELATESRRPLMLEFSHTTFADTERPVLTIEDVEFVSVGPISAIYTLDLGIQPEPVPVEHTLLLSLSGTSPGFTAMGVTVPLVFDVATQAVIDSNNSSNLINFFGTFDAEGRSKAELSLPANYFVPGTTVYASYIAAYENATTAIGASNPVRFVVTAPN